MLRVYRQYIIVWWRTLAYLEATKGADSREYTLFSRFGFPFGVILLDLLMLAEPLGLLAVLPLPPWLIEFVPAFKALRQGAHRLRGMLGGHSTVRRADQSLPPPPR